MSCCSPRNVIVAQVERVPFAAHCERRPIGREYQSVVTPPTPFERVFTCLYRAGSRGIVREPEGVETPQPGRSSENTWSKP